MAFVSNDLILNYFKLVKRKFDPRLKLDAIKGYIPREFKGIVNPLNISRWKREKWNKLVGYNYYNDRDNNNNKDYDSRILNMEIISLEKKLSIARAENEVISLAIKIGSNSREFERVIFKNKSHVIKCVEKNKKLFNVTNFSKLLNLNKNTYYEWKQLDKGTCNFSKNLLCIKRHPNQVSIEEEDRIIELLLEKRYEHFPISSLMWQARLEHNVFACRGVWDRIKKQNGIVRKRHKKSPKYYRQGLRAEYANQYLHADITYFKIENRKTYFIYLVKDNYSRYIKSWAISDTISATTRVSTFKAALADLNNDGMETSFVTDSGTENKAKVVRNYIKGLKNVKLILARKDTPYSNSMIERYNHSLKYMYLYRDRVKSLGDLKKLLEIAIKEHNYTKPLDLFKGQTPYEVYHGLPSKTEWVYEQWRQVIKDRVEKINTIICCLGTPIKITRSN